MHRGLILLILLLAGLPLCVQFPAIVDYPFHVAHASIYHNLNNPEFGFREYFEVTPLFSIPYRSFMWLSSFLMYFLPSLIASKLATFMLLLMLPTGLAILCWGLRKDPLLGITAIPFMWGNLAHWGFLNYLAALGLSLSTYGFLLRFIDTNRRIWLLASMFSVVGVFFSHIARMPLLLCICLIVPGLERRRKISRWSFAPFLLSAALTTLWYFHRLAWFDLGPPIAFTFDLKRCSVLLIRLFGSFSGKDIRFAIFAWISGLCLWTIFATSIRKSKEEAEVSSERVSRLQRWTVGGFAVFSFALYLSEPTKFGVWPFVFGREATAAVLFLLALIPDISKGSRYRLAYLLFLVGPVLAFQLVITHRHVLFSMRQGDFMSFIEQLPMNPSVSFSKGSELGFEAGEDLDFASFQQEYIVALRGGHISPSYVGLGPMPIQRKADTEKQSETGQAANRNEWILIRSKNPPPVPNGATLVHEGPWWFFKVASGH